MTKQLPNIPRWVIQRRDGLFFECSDGFGGLVWCSDPYDATSWKFRTGAQAYARYLRRANLGVVARYACATVPPEASRR